MEWREQGQKNSPQATIPSLRGSKKILLDWSCGGRMTLYMREISIQISSLPSRKKIWLLAMHQSIFKHTDGSVLKNRAFSVWKGLKKTHNSLATQNVLCFSVSSHFYQTTCYFFLKWWISLCSVFLNRSTVSWWWCGQSAGTHHQICWSWSLLILTCWCYVSGDRWLIVSWSIGLVMLPRSQMSKCHHNQ